jgi:diguanylate cyclase (GGDEF)-like protein
MARGIKTLVVLAALLMLLLTLIGAAVGIFIGSGEGSLAALSALWASLPPKQWGLIAGGLLIVVALGAVALYIAADRGIGASLRHLRREAYRLVSKEGEGGPPAAELDTIESAFATVARRLRLSEQQDEELERLRDRFARRDRFTSVIHEIVKQINSSLEISQLRSTSLRALLTGINADFTAFLWIDSHYRTATLERVGRETGADRTLQHQLAALPTSRAELSRMLERWQPWNWIALRLENPGWQALASDLFVAENFAGVVVALRSGEWPFSPEEEQMFGIIMEDVQVALENARLYELAIRDELTGLFTRRYFEQRADQQVSRCRRLRVPLSIVMIDLNNFKAVNDQLGHLTGDQVLGEVGRVISSSVRNFDLPVRYGGDEFLLLLPNANTEQARLVAQRVQRNFEQIPPPRLQGPGQMGVAYGIATFPDDATDTGELVRLADQRMYQDKSVAKTSDPSPGSTPGAPTAA